MSRASLAWLAAVGLAFTPALLDLARLWASVPYYSHGFLVPVFAWAAASAHRRELGPIGVHPASGWVWIPVLGAYALGVASASVSLQGLALVGAMAAGVFQLWGAAGLRLLAFPLLFLLFMVPPPPALVSPFIGWLQLQVSIASVEVLRAAGFSIAREGNLLLQPGGESLFIAEACSGITSLLTLTPLAVALAWYTERAWGRRLLIVASVVPLAMAANLLRVVAITLATKRWGGASVLESSWHEIGGLATFALACAGLLAVSCVVKWERNGAEA